MKLKVVTLTLIFALSPAFAFAQGRGPGGGGGQGAGQRGTQRQGQAGQMGKAQGQGQMDRDRQHLRTHVADQQRDQFKTCTQDMDRLRTQSRDMLNATGTAFTPDNARQVRDQFQQQFQTMQQEHETLMNGLDPDQKAAVQNRVRNMQQVQSRISTRLQAMNEELSSDSPNQQRLREHARYIERETSRWQKEYRNVGQDLTLTE